MFCIVIHRTDCLKMIYARLIASERHDEATQCGVGVGMIQRKGNVPCEHLNVIDVIVSGNWQFRFFL